MLTTAPSLQARIHHGDPHAVADLLSRPGAVVDGHFELLSGRHSDRFVAFSRIAESPPALDVLAAWLVPTLAPLVPDAVVAPRTAGVALGWTLARQLTVPFHLTGVDQRGRPDELLGPADISGRRILLVNDVVTTGEGLRAMREIVSACRAEVAGAAWFLSRSDVDVTHLIGAPTAHVVSAELPSWSPDRCSLCEHDEPLTPVLDLN